MIHPPLHRSDYWLVALRRTPWSLSWWLAVWAILWGVRMAIPWPEQLEHPLLIFAAKGDGYLITHGLGWLVAVVGVLSFVALQRSWSRCYQATAALLALNWLIVAVAWSATSHLSPPAIANGWFALAQTRAYLGAQRW